MRLDENISLAFAGLSADARVLINLGRLECQNFRLMVEDSPTVEYVTRVLGQTQQRYTQRGGTRPVGISTIIGGVGADGKPQLWTTDPSGVYSAWKANAVGRNSKSLLELLEKQYREGCSEAEALKVSERAHVWSAKAQTLTGPSFPSPPPPPPLASSRSARSWRWLSPAPSRSRWA